MVDSEKETGEEKSEAQIVKGDVNGDVKDVERDADLDEDFAGEVFRPEGKNIFQKYTAQAATVLFHPKKFFAALPADGWAEPALFLCASAGIYGFLQALGHSNPLLFFSTFFNGLLYTSVGSVIVWSVFSKGCKGQGSLSQTFRVLAYSKATLLFAWVMVGHMAIGGYLSVAYTLYLNYVGLSKVHKLNRRITIGLVLGMSLLSLALKKFTG
jgi:hypothetical protein